MVTNGVCGEVTSTERRSVWTRCRSGVWRWPSPRWSAPTAAPDHFERADRGIQKWQSSTDNWATTNDITRRTTRWLTGNLVTNTVFRAVVTNGVCGEAYSTEAGVTVDAIPVGGMAVAGASVVCSNSGT